MPIDFSRLRTVASADSILEPREIFRALPEKQPRYQFPRDVQTEVWTRWFERRVERDLVLKMNTGSGKTVVGLILLKSCLNERVGPAVYVAPTPQLADQVMTEAKSLGLAVDRDPEALTVLRGRAIAVTTIKTLFNGRSRFGLADEGPRIEIGSLVVDDAHACLQETEGQFTLNIPATSAGYDRLVQLFQDNLAQQAGTRMQELLEHEPNTRIQVPFWGWHAKLTEVGEILYSLRASPEAEWEWPLLRSVLAECRCVVGEGAVEISPRMIPVDLIPSFVRAQRRVFMTATLSDDSVLVSHFDVDPAAVRSLVVPNSANDIGDRMILVPQALNPTLKDEDLKNYLIQKAAHYNVVVIVPSGFRASFWRDAAAQVLTAENLAAGIETLKRGVVGLTVIVNRYDGIDLPDDACRILVIDGLPDVRRLIDKVEQGIRHGSNRLKAEAMQRIEQGMGRGNRSANDWCVVLLMSRRLAAQLYSTGAETRFTEATRVQFSLSEQLAEQLGGANIGQVDEAINHCLTRAQQWVAPSRNALVGVRYATTGRIDPVVVARRQAFNAARIQDLSSAIQRSREAVEVATDTPTRGWLLAEQAAYQHRIDPAQAQVTLRSGKQINPQVVTPLDGITYQRLGGDLADQAIQCQRLLRSRYTRGPELIVAVNAILDDLKFEPETAPAFEVAMACLGELIGFATQRPESEYARGPDVLWRMGGLAFAVIECKNGATTDRIAKRDCDQLSGSVNWFRDEYDHSCTCQPLLIHPSSRAADDASPSPGSRICTAEKLEALKDAVRGFAVACAARPQFGTPQDIAALLSHYGFTAGEIFQRYATPAR
jgi:hypothetical protein